MDKEKEIEGMKNTLVNYAMKHDLCFSFEAYRINAKALVEAGYGNVKQAVKDFAENAVKPIICEIVTLMFNDYEPHCKIDTCGKGDDILCGCSICVEENTQIWKSKIDQKIKELYGAETK